MSSAKQADSLDSKAHQALSLAEGQRIAHDADRTRLQKVPKTSGSAFPFLRN